MNKEDPAADISDGVCAYLQGGFGNQLFILAAAWSQSRRLDCPLYVDISRFIAPDPLERGHETPRTFELNELRAPGQLLTSDSPWLANSPRRPPAIRRLGRRSRRLRVFQQDGFGYDARIDAIRPGTTILGYFQSPLYFQRVELEMRELLGGGGVVPRAAVSLHLRRGDYLGDAAAAHHGVASAEYAGRAVRLMRRLLPDVNIRLFSDSPGLADAELQGVDGWAHAVDVESLGPLATVREMSRASGFIMSNSSFSWWAAWLMDAASDATVVGPRPWLRSGEGAADLLLPHWLTLDAR
jgi:hypothetical protein